MRSGLRGTTIGVWTIAALCLAGSAAVAADDAQVTVGKQEYMKYCATCHGPTGNGKGGSASEAFTKPPTDLTTLAKNNGGKFPMIELFDIVKGNRPIAAHGTKDNPVWGQVLGRPLKEGMYGEDSADAQMINVGKYLETIQAK